jgi:hypothetical protein
VHFASRLSRFWTDSASLHTVTVMVVAQIRNRYDPRGFSEERDNNSKCYDPRGFSEERENNSSCFPCTFVSLSGVIPHTPCIFICHPQDRQ